MAYKVYIALIDKPKTWRAIIIPSNYTFSDLHISIQCAMGWSNSHLYQFSLHDEKHNANVIIAEHVEFYDDSTNFVDSRKLSISTKLNEESTLHAFYIYDFGDYWRHWIKIVETSGNESETILPICFGGNGICPPEDSGCINDYFDKQEHIQDELPRTLKDPIEPSNSNSMHTAFDQSGVLFWSYKNTDLLFSPLESSAWLKRLIQGDLSLDELLSELCHVIPIHNIKELHKVVITKPLKQRNRATIILGNAKGIPLQYISDSILVPVRTMQDLINRFHNNGLNCIYKLKSGLKQNDPLFIEKVFSILHAPPSSYGFNRTTWRQEDIVQVMRNEGFEISRGVVGSIIRNSGYSYKKARTVLTSNDPEYKEKLEHITNILANLSVDEKFFSIDEYGPFSIKFKGGKSLVPPGTIKSVPQWQKSKGSLILTAALELSTNQVMHFYSENKNTKEMIKLLRRLLESYPNEKTIYFSWDAASWHASKELYETVDKINSDAEKDSHSTPIIELAPLPTSAQFLNVIESVFSGMARAIIHNSDYQSVDECKDAIDTYFKERNMRFVKNPKKAGKKIWGKERVKPSFSKSNNCKDPRYR